MANCRVEIGGEQKTHLPESQQKDTPKKHPKKFAQVQPLCYHYAKKCAKTVVAQN